MPAKFSKSVFINCPYDDEYVSTLRPVVFTVLYLGFHPCMALDCGDSGSIRFERIKKLIRDCKFSIHDLSRLSSSRPCEYFRLNMAFELGLDLGCRIYGNRQLKTKKCMIFEGEKHSLKVALSDLSSSDPFFHNGEPREAVRGVRNWLVQEAGAAAVGSEQIWFDFNEFMGWLDLELIRNGFNRDDINALPMTELQENMRKWIRRKKTPVTTGVRPGKGSYVCKKCREKVTLDDPDSVLPPCPSCSGTNFLKTE